MAIEIESLEQEVAPVLPEDPIAEAGRKVLLKNFVKMLNREAGSRTGENIEDVHQMRVAIRRMRSALGVFAPYFKDKSVAPYAKGLKKTGRALGPVRDLDVMIDDLGKYATNLNEEEAQAVQGIIDILDKRRVLAREDLNAWLDSKSYRRFVRAFAEFLTKPGKGVVNDRSDGAVVPYQVRHVLPPLLHETLAGVRAYDTVIDDAEVETLHSLRIEFKRLRYTVDFFTDVLGASADAYIDEIKQMQDYLGRLNDVVVAHERLDILSGLNEAQVAVRDAYLQQLDTEAQHRQENFREEAWEPFNKRTVQQKMASALLVLR